MEEKGKKDFDLKKEVLRVIGRWIFWFTVLTMSLLVAVCAVAEALRDLLWSLA